jgi:hypothetical protein
MHFDDTDKDSSIQEEIVKEFYRNPASMSISMSHSCIILPGLRNTRDKLILDEGLPLSKNKLNEVEHG